ncbi:MAG TPA: hypothetical protein VI934_01570 [Candidatus Nanoarchaeia archaeon]|nr:hypothetical protein [Candidatus Nanoarchaeia archaeon]
MPQEKQFRREAARKASIGEILKGEFVEAEEGTAALNIAGQATRRLNLLATVVDKDNTESQSYKSLVVDDGTAQIRLRFFEAEAPLFEKLQIGDFAVIIGKPRSYGSEVYITPEIARPLTNLKWAEVRKLELKLRKPREHAMAPATENLAEQSVTEEPDDVVSKEKMELYKIVKELDAGRGVDLSEVTAKSGMGNAESLIKEMLRNGDLFEVLPGRLKILE